MGRLHSSHRRFFRIHPQDALPLGKRNYNNLPPKHFSITRPTGIPLFAHLQPDVVFPIQQNTVQNRTNRTPPGRWPLDCRRQTAKLPGKFVRGLVGCFTTLDTLTRNQGVTYKNSTTVSTACWTWLQQKATSSLCFARVFGTKENDMSPVFFGMNKYLEASNIWTVVGRWILWPLWNLPGLHKIVPAIVLGMMRALQLVCP